MQAASGPDTSSRFVAFVRKPTRVPAVVSAMRTASKDIAAALGRMTAERLRQRNGGP